MAEKIKIMKKNTIEENLIMDRVVDTSLKKKSKIEISNVSVWYDDFNALDGIDLAIQPKTVTAFIGPSGCGKSTFLRLFNRMNDYVDGFRMEGKISIDGSNIYKNKLT